MSRSKSSNRSKSSKGEPVKVDKENKQMICSPTNTNKSYTCYSDKSLERLRELWNAKHPDNKITESTSKEIWKELKKKYE